MQPSISVVTLAVEDLAKAVHFYQTAFGWPSKGIIGDAEKDTEVAFLSSVVVCNWRSGHGRVCNDSWG